jgi:hypothetical protein
MLSALVACSITFGYQFSRDGHKYEVTMKNDRALWQLLNDALSSANERSISVSTRIRPRFQEPYFLTVAMTVGKADEAGTRAQNQHLTSSIDD